LDFEEAWQRNLRWARHRWDPGAITNGLSIQNQILDIEVFREWFYGTGGLPLEEFHERLLRELPWLPR
jgi:hypothetical protein